MKTPENGPVVCYRVGLYRFRIQCPREEQICSTILVDIFKHGQLKWRRTDGDNLEQTLENINPPVH